jgi:hypothetical protein
MEITPQLEEQSGPRWDQALVQHLPKGVKTRPTRRSLFRFAYFAECEDDKRLPEIPLEPEGWTAAECFHVHETFGHLLPCKEPVMLTRALNGKQWHGLTVTNCAEDYIGRLLFASELKANYPEWVRQDILGRARQLAQRDLGYVPTFVLTGEDFTTLGPLLSVQGHGRRDHGPKNEDG